MALIPTHPLPDFPSLARIVGGEIGDVIFHAPHEVQAILWEARNGKASEVLLALHADPVKQLKYGTDKGSGRPKEPSVSPRES